MLSPETFKKVYTMLDAVSPLTYDCGRLCQSACCSREAFTDEDDYYIYLLPGEMEYLKEAGSDLTIERQLVRDHYLPDSWGKYVYIARCNGPESCDRHLRPIQCRTFPLQPHLTPEGDLRMIFCNVDIPYICPLLSGYPPISDDFVRNVCDAWKILIEDSAIYDLVRLDSSTGSFAGN